MSGDGAVGGQRVALRLVQQWLREHGYARALAALDDECGDPDAASEGMSTAQAATDSSALFVAPTATAATATATAAAATVAAVTATTAAAAAALAAPPALVPPAAESAQKQEEQREEAAAATMGGLLDLLVDRHVVAVPGRGICLAEDADGIGGGSGSAGGADGAEATEAERTRRRVLEGLLATPDAPRVTGLAATLTGVHSANVLCTAFGDAAGSGAATATAAAAAAAAGGEDGDDADDKKRDDADEDDDGEHAVVLPAGEAVRLVATGSADKTVRVTDIGAVRKDGTGARPVAHLVGAHTGPVLSLDFSPTEPHLLLSSAMDGKHALSDIRDGGKVLQTFHDHQKYVVAARWCPSGNIFATASHDGTVNVYRRPDSGEGEFAKAASLEFLTKPESITFAPGADCTKLLVAVREDNYLHEVDLGTMAVANKFNMNGNLDDHVSFSALNVAYSPGPGGDRLLLVSTDADRLNLYAAGDSKPVRCFYGSQNDEYCQPRCAWSPTGRYIYSTSQDKKVYTWDIRNQLLVSRLGGHTAQIRDLRPHPTLDVLVTAGFDKTVRLWDASEAQQQQDGK